MQTLHDEAQAVAIVEETLAERIEGHIMRRTGGQIRNLHVTLSEDRLLLQGRSRTYHAKQLAQEAALDLTGTRLILANEIAVR